MIDKNLVKARLADMGEDGLCKCSCADKCPFNKVGSTMRCSRTELVDALAQGEPNGKRTPADLVRFNWRQFVEAFGAFLSCAHFSEHYATRREIASSALRNFNHFIEAYEEGQTFDTLTNPPSIEDANEAGSVLVFHGDTQSWHRAPWKLVAERPSSHPVWRHQPPKPKKSAAEVLWNEIVEKKSCEFPAKTVFELLQWLKEHPDRLKQI